MKKNYPLLEQAILDAPTIAVGNYAFRSYAIGERGTTLSPGLIREVTTGLVDSLTSDGQSLDSLVSIQTTGAMWAALVANELALPLHVFTDSPNGTKWQREVMQITGYRERTIYSPKFGDIGRCAIIDDVLSTGKTLTMMVEELRRSDEPVGVSCVVDKDGKAAEMSIDLDLPVRALACARWVIENASQ